MRRVLTAITLFATAIIFASCLNINYGTTGDTPGSFSYYEQEAFQYQLNFCSSSDANCIYEIANYFAGPMQNNGWHLVNGLTDALFGSTFSSHTNASTIIGDNSNLVYVSSHGATNNGQSTICLFYCNGNAYGSNVAVNTVAIPNGWLGPNWLIIDACDVVVAGAGWESKFGGSLHGILGFSQDVTTPDASAIGQSGLSTLTTDIQNYVPAIKAWEDAVATAEDTPEIGMAVPNSNAADVIEAPGGPHFGYNGDTGPSFYVGQPDGSISVTQPAGIAVNGTTYSLTAESMNESSWLSTYGNPAGRTVTPSSNEHDFISTNPVTVVRHYLASGGVIYESGAAGSSGAVSLTQAYQYALSWINSNGGLPSDAVLSYAGHITNPNASVIIPPPTAANIPTSSYPPYMNVRQWVFIWRHGSNGVLFGDKIEVHVDDAGHWTVSRNPCPGQTYGPCLVPPWNPAPNVPVYTRVWRTLGAANGSIAMQTLPATYTLNVNGATATRSITGLCTPDMASTSNTATPCQEYNSGSAQPRYFLSFATGKILGAR